LAVSCEKRRSRSAPDATSGRNARFAAGEIEVCLGRLQLRPRRLDPRLGLARDARDAFTAASAEAVSASAAENLVW